MKFEKGNIYHIYNQGNNREKIFFERKNYLFFLKKMRKHLLKHCDFLAWCLMPNHFHWMVKIHDSYEAVSRDNIYDPSSPKVEPLNRDISVLLSSYTKAINNAYDRSGALFRSRTKAKNLNEDLRARDNYPLVCFCYIHQNPLEAGLVVNLEGWEFSSYRDFAGLRNGALCNINLAIELLELPSGHAEFADLSCKTIPDEVIHGIFKG